MKTLSKAILVTSMATAATAAQAELSVTGGFMSDYVFRGVQTSTGSGYASVDYSEAGFSAGIWAADLDDEGLEVDIYLGYGFEFDGDFTLDLGYTRYEYTDNTANDAAGDSQDEFSLGLGVAGFGLTYVFGINNDAGASGPAEDDQDYDVITLTYDADNWGALIGRRDADDIDGLTTGEAEYNWAEVSVSQEVAGFDIGATVGVQFGLEEDGVDTSSNDGYIVFDISKSFDL